MLLADDFVEGSRTHPNRKWDASVVCARQRAVPRWRGWVGVAEQIHHTPDRTPRPMTVADRCEAKEETIGLTDLSRYIVRLSS